VISLKEKIVIVGGGAAAISAIKTIREINAQSEITVFGEEKFYPYYRIKMSKALLGGLEEEKLLIQNKQWYGSNNVELYLNRKVTGLIPRNKEITLDDGSSVSYSKLLLANGASNLVPPINGINKPGVFTLRELDGAFKISNYLKDIKTILLIGGGVQNLEIANVLSKNGKKVIIAEFASRLMPRQLDDFSSDRLRHSIEAQGIEVMLNTQVQEILGEGKAEGFITKSGIHSSCDMSIYSTGIMPNIQIAHNTKLNVNKGIIVNERMETNINDIFAAGDISEYNGRVYGLWSIATQQGKIAGANICSQKLTFEAPAPVTSLDAFNMSLFSLGDIEEGQDTDLLIESQNEGYKYCKIFIRNNRIVGTIVLGNTKKFMAIKKLMEGNINVDFDKSIHWTVDKFIEQYSQHLHQFKK
jgi:nitrite reductase (NADH) large subunit